MYLGDLAIELISTLYTIAYFGLSGSLGFLSNGCSGCFDGLGFRDITHIMESQMDKETGT